MVQSSRARPEEAHRQFKVGSKIPVNLDHGKIEDATVRAVIQDDDGLKLQVARRRPGFHCVGRRAASCRVNLPWGNVLLLRRN